MLEERLPLYPTSYHEYDSSEAFILKDGKWVKLDGTQVLLADQVVKKAMRRHPSGSWVQPEDLFGPVE